MVQLQDAVGDIIREPRLWVLPMPRVLSIPGLGSRWCVIVTLLTHLVALTGIWREELLELVGNAVELLGISRRFAFDRDVRPN